MARSISRRELLGASLAFFATRSPAQDASGGDVSLERIDDLRVLAQRIRHDRIALLILFSTPACPYCLEVRRNYLRPRLRETPSVALIREVDITSRRALVDFDGKPIAEADLAARYGVKMVPFVLLLDADGAPLAEALIGVDRAGFYEARLAATLQAAALALRSRR